MLREISKFSKENFKIADLQPAILVLGKICLFLAPAAGFWPSKLNLPYFYPATALLPPCYCPTATALLLLPYCYCPTATALRLPYCYCYY